MSEENAAMVATADGTEDVQIPIVGPEVTETTTIDVGGDVDRISVTASAEDAGSPTEDVVDTLTMPEKFANAENPQAALLKAYQELERQRSEGTKEETPESKEDTGVESEAADKAMEDLQSDRQKASKVEDYSKLWAEQKGSLTDDQWSAASKDLGIGVDDLKAYEAYRKGEIGNEVNANDTKIYEAAGGEDAYNKMIDWASANMNDAQLDALNNQLDNPQFSEMGTNMLKQLYTNAVGFEATTSVTNKANQLGNTDMFHSDAEMQAAMNHPEYGRGGKYDMEFDRKTIALMKSRKQI